MSPAWEPPGGPTRAAGGLLGVAGGETWRDGNGRVEPDGPVTTALVDLCHSYVARRGDGVPLEVAKRHDGVAGPAWLLAVAVVRDDERERVAETLELALAAGVALHDLGDCVSYVEMAARLFAGQPAEAVVEASTGRPVLPVGPGGPELCGESVADALAAGLWALCQTGGVADVVQALSGVAPPSVGAAAAGLVGLRDGGGAVPAHWHRRLRCSAACLALAPGLVRARCRTSAEDGVGRGAGDRGADGASPGTCGPLVVRATCARSAPSELDPFARPFQPRLVGVAAQ
jgi:hypothetical protein